MTQLKSGALAGTGIVVTRAEDPGGPLARKLSARGANVLHWQSVQIRPPANTEPLRQKLQSLDEYDWIVFSSPRAVAAVTRLVEQRIDGPRVAAAGTKTAQALEAAGWEVDLIPVKGAGGQALVDAFEMNRFGSGARVLFPASSIARGAISAGLTRLGAQVDLIEAYETVRAELDRSACLAQFRAGQVDAITFTSPSSVDGLMRCLGRDAFMEIVNAVSVIVIGRTTGQALRDAGVTRFCTAATCTLDGLVEAVSGAIHARSN